jgi:hypothetical protein
MAQTAAGNAGAGDDPVDQAPRVAHYRHEEISAPTESGRCTLFGMPATVP